VGCHQLLLLAQCVEEAERIDAEGRNGEHRQRRQGRQCARAGAQPLAPGGGRQDQEGEHQARRRLDADAGHRRHRRRAKARLPARQRQGAGDRDQHQGVVVGASHGQLQQDGVEADEYGRHPRRAAGPLGGPRRQRHRREAGKGGDQLQRPQAAGEAERDDRIAAEREQRAVWGVLEGPAHEREDRVGGRFGRHVGVGVEAVQDAQPPERQVAEHVLGDERWAEDERQVGGHHADRDRSSRQAPRGGEGGEVAGAHDQRQRLEGAIAQSEPHTVQRTGKPTGPAAGPRRDVAAGMARRGDRQAERARHGSHQADHPERAQEASRRARRGASVRSDRYASHVAVLREPPPPCARPSQAVRPTDRA
jgi:hypothetical protein